MQAYPVPWWGWLIVLLLIPVCVALVSLVFEIGQWLVEKKPSDEKSRRPPGSR